MLAVVLTVLLLLAAPVVPGAVAQEDDDDGAPSVPASYYGDVTVNGEPAEVGTVITAVVDGEEHGSIEVSESGEYGGPNALDEKLVVEGADPGDTVSFVVRGVEAEETVEWESGDVREVDLTFENVPETDGSDGGTDGGSTDGTDGGSTDGSGAGSGGGGAAGDTSETTATDGETPSDVDSVEEVTGTEVVRESTANVTVDPETNRSRATFDGNVSVSEVTFQGTTNGSVSVAELSNPPDETGSPPGATLSVADIQVPDDAENQPATVRMRVSNDRLDELGAAPEDLRINRFADGEWQGLATRVAEETANGVVLEADTPGFSFFAASAVGEPDAEITISPDAADVGADVTLNGSASSDPYGEIVSYEWSVADRELTGETVSLAIDETGEYTVELVVTNDAGETDNATGTLVVSDGDSGDSSADTAAASDGSTQSTDSGGATDGATRNEPGLLGGFSPLWLLGIGVVAVGVALGVTLARRGSSSDDRL